MTRFISVENQSGERIAAKGFTLIPFSQSVRINFGKFSGFIWNRPVSLLVQHPDGDERVLSINDPTRTALWSILGFTIIFGLLFMIRIKSDEEMQ